MIYEATIEEEGYCGGGSNSDTGFLTQDTIMVRHNLFKTYESN